MKLISFKIHVFQKVTQSNKKWLSDLEERMIFAVEFANIWTWSHYGDIESG